jgi:hypothetical protein
MRAGALLVLAFFLAGCGTEHPTTTPIPTPAFVCPTDNPIRTTPAPGGCAAEERAALAAVSGLGYAVARVVIIPEGWTCRLPFDPPAACFAPTIVHVPAAYVYFVGTNHVAAIEFSWDAAGTVTAKVWTFEEPPPHWTPGPG